MTIGHEFCGHVSQISGQAISADGTTLEVGQPVMADPRLNCKDCLSCHDDDTNMCLKLAFLGLHGGGGGGFSEFVAVSASMCHPLPRTTPLDQAVLIEPLAVGRRALTNSGIPTDVLKHTSVLLIGGGPVGYSILCNLNAVGAKQIFVSEPSTQRQALVKPLVEVVFDPIKQNVPEECRKRTGGRGVDLVFDCAGITPGMKDGMAALRTRGTFVNVAGWETDFVLPLEYFMFKELIIRTSIAYNDKDFGEVVRDFVAGKTSETVGGRCDIG